MTKINIEKIKDDYEFQQIIKEIIENETVNEMKKYRQHGSTDCFEHCYNASYLCYKISKKLNLDYKAAARGAMLHDLFLYDWRVKGDRKGLHAYTHGRLAYENACKLFKLNATEKDMIINHMWPTTIIPPKTKEGFILTAVDKYCAITETSKYMYEEHCMNWKIFRYANRILER